MINSRRFPRVDATFPVQVREPSGRSVVGQAVRSDTDGTAFAFVNLTKPDFFRLRHQAERLFRIIDHRFLRHRGLILPNAEEALAYLAEDQHDAILLDLSLPGMSGLHSSRPRPSGASDSRSS